MLSAVQKKPSYFILGFIMMVCSVVSLKSQSNKLTKENILEAFARVSESIGNDTLRPAYHLTPPAGCMGDPNGGIFYDGWYHIFYGLHPFAGHPGGWYWAHAKSKDFLNWTHFAPELTPAFDLGLNYIGSGSTITDIGGRTHAFYSASNDDEMKFWQAHMIEDLNKWEHPSKNPILTLDHPNLPPFHDFWRDPFVFETDGRTFLIACADLLEEDYVPVPIFEATNEELNSWEYKGILFEYPKHKYRNFEVPELRPIGDKWIFLASSDAPLDNCVYFTGSLDLEELRFIPEDQGILDYSGHYYAQETILDDKGDLYLMSWIPGWDREWLPRYMNQPLKNDGSVWNGCFAIPRKLTLDNNGKLIQKPVESFKALRGDLKALPARELPVTGPMTAHDVLRDVSGNQLELEVELELNAASFCGINVLCDDQGNGGLYIMWTGDILTVDGVKVSISDWQPGNSLKLNIFIDKQLVEIFVNDGTYCISRQVRKEHIKGNRVSLTRLGGTATLKSLKAWQLKSIY